MNGFELTLLLVALSRTPLEKAMNVLFAGDWSCHRHFLASCSKLVAF